MAESRSKPPKLHGMGTSSKHHYFRTASACDQSVQLLVHLRGAGCGWGAGQQDGAEHLGGEVAALHVYHRADQLQRLTWSSTQAQPADSLHKPRADRRAFCCNVRF
jgi:hypothetical protein